MSNTYVEIPVWAQSQREDDQVMAIAGRVFKRSVFALF